jgi:hypothetical protein
MAAGAHVFRANRVGVWVIPNANLTDKLKHVLPRLRGPIPNLTDIFLPPEATKAHADQCRAAGFFVSTYDVAHSTPPGLCAANMLAHRNVLKTGALEIDLEGAAVQPDRPALAAWAEAFVRRVRSTNPNLPIRLNVTPFKGYALPVSLINSDPQLFVIAQAYFGNQDGRCSEADVILDLLDWGVARDKVSVMYGALCENPQQQRVYALPNPEYKPITSGSVFSDDLLLDAGVL